MQGESLDAKRTDPRRVQLSTLAAHGAEPSLLSTAHGARLSLLSIAQAGSELSVLACAHAGIQF